VVGESSATGARSGLNLTSFRKEVVLALLGGGEQLRELWRVPQRRQQRIFLQSLIGTIFAITAVRLKVEENQLVGIFSKIGVVVDALKGA
jgi:hypothetical protein